MPASAQPAIAIAPQAAVGTAFSYQGQLKKQGVPVSGTCDFTFKLYDAAENGVQVGGGLNQSLSVTNGLFMASLDFGANAFDGAARWLETSVGCPSGSPQTLLGRQPLLAAPYALGLRPGTKVEGTAYQSLIVNTHAPTGGVPVAIVGQSLVASDGAGVYGANFSTSATNGIGVWGRNYGVGGSGVLGTAVNGGSGVRGETSSLGGYGGYFSNPAAAGAALYADGNVKQSLSATGLVKAGAYIFCQTSANGGSSVIRSFNNVSSAAITAQSVSPGSGSCLVNIGFSLTGRYIIATPTGIFGSVCSPSAVPPVNGSQMNVLLRSQADGSDIDYCEFTVLVF
jgi:hypothetical protein